MTSPRKTPSGMSPLAFMQGMRAAHARLDAYAQNPYAVGRGETPLARARARSCFTMASLPTIRTEVTRNFGAKPLWLTEYGYQTNPPDRLLGVSYALQATYIGEAALRVWQQPGVTMLIQFLVRDEPSLGGWQSGLFSVGGRGEARLPRVRAAARRGVAAGRAHGALGAGAPGPGARATCCSGRSAAGGRRSAATATTGAERTFMRTVALPAGARVRIFAPTSAGRAPRSPSRSGAVRETTPVDAAAPHRAPARRDRLGRRHRRARLRRGAAGAAARGRGARRTLRAFGARWRPIGWSSLGVAIVTGAVIAARAHAFDRPPRASTGCSR